MSEQPPTSAPTRRRLLIAAGAAAIAAAGPVAALPARRPHRLYRWRGKALGAEAEMLLDAGSEERGAALAELCLAEIARLEQIFSLFRADSAISRLNREGRLPAPPPEMRELLALCRQIRKASGGAFDPTIQPLWQALAEEAAPERLDVARAAIGFDKLRLSTDEIAFAEPGMAITLNGIAQGYITDRVAELLHRQGIGRTLLQLGETRALGPRPDGAAWQVGIPDPARQGGGLRRLPLAEGALAVSSLAGPPMPGLLGHGHLLDPEGGRVLRKGKTVAVFAPQAALADGLSTALAVMDRRDAAARLLDAFPDARAMRLD